ncbi:hypothetical protein McanMca71_002600 [Microsporum canis]
MSIFSSLKNSFLSATNENNASLANLKFDFSLLKVEAPIEFQPLGSALTLRRREEAEYGPQHQTARRLAALFEPLIPPTPKLISAYGKRVSEIIETPGVNPVGSRSHGPFREYIGADGTAVWAAATSGVAALGIYLLSCLLARAWESKEAISIWVELVDQRKKEIENAFESSHPVSIASAMSSLQSIARHDLALWDASSRSWLRTADQAKQREHKQLLLMRKNITIPFLGGSSTYDKVISTWKRAMLAIEDLLCGRPQSISDAGVLLALSSWHLYPDLIVLRNKTVNVKFEDPLFPCTGVCTIGLEIQPSGENEGVQWSLALSHLQYYGNAVNVTSPADYSRVTISQLCLVALGGLLGHWGANARDLEDAVKLFCSIGDILDGKDRKIVYSAKWIQPLIQASRKFDSSTGEERDENIRLLKYGQRRASQFLRRDEDTIPPYFGLCNEPVLSALSGSECNITYLRWLAKSMGSASSDCLIIRVHSVGSTSKGVSPDYYEYITAVPYRTKVHGKRDSEGGEVFKMTHARWYFICSKSATNRADIEMDIKRRIAEIGDSNEYCTIVKHGWTDQGEPRRWHNPPLLFRSGQVRGQPAASDLECPMPKEQGACQCFDLKLVNIPYALREFSSTQFIRTYGNLRLSLFVRGTDNRITLPGACLECGNITPRAAVQHLLQRPICKERLDRYLDAISSRTLINDARISVFIESRFIPEDSRLALDALYFATVLYSYLGGSTIMPGIVSKPLHKARWVTTRWYGEDGFYRAKAKKIYQVEDKKIPLSRQEAFACIAHLGSGQANIDPNDLESTLAMCTENSIFVAAAVLSDPAAPINEYNIRRLVGNIGRKGISMLIAPRNPQIRPLQDDHRIVNHAPYDLKRENNFSDTSLHLSFTNWTLPLATTGTQTIDQDVYLVESVIAVRDRGEWVADLDILGIDKSRLTLGSGDVCPSHDGQPLEHEYTSIDCWEELLDPPLDVGVFRARGNWVARLAAVSILMQKSKSSQIAIFDRVLCLESFECQFQKILNKSPRSFICID